jgi:hypothetical protein
MWLRALVSWIGRPKWTACVDIELGVVDLLPRGDTIAHECGEDCVCGPAVKMHEPDDAIRWTYRHHKLGGA